MRRMDVTTSQPAASEPLHTDTTKTTATAKAYGNRNFKPTKLPGLGSGPLFPEWVHRLFRRKDTPASR